MIYQLILLKLIVNMVLSLQCKKASPSNCIYNSTCKYDVQECRSPSNSAMNRGGIYCAAIIRHGNEKEIIVGEMDCIYDQETSKTCKNQSECLMSYTSKDKTFLHCCCDTDFCNEKFIIKSSSEVNRSVSIIEENETLCHGFLCKHIILIVFILSLIAVLLIIGLCIGKKFLKSQEKLYRLIRRSSTRPVKSDCLLAKEDIINQEIDFNDLIIENCIKKGRFSNICKGIYRNEVVAIKCYLNNDQTDEGKYLFEHEKSIYSLPFTKHENILEYFGYSINNGMNYLITDLSRFGSLRDVLRSRLLKDENELTEICQQISSGIEYLHQDFRKGNSPENNSRRPIAHRDLKPENILYLNSTRLVICDFALSIELNQNENLPNEQQQIGTPRYMPPEILAGTIGLESHALLKADVYSLGIIFWEVLSRFKLDQEQPNDNIYEMPFDKQLREHGFNVSNPDVNQMLQIINLGSPSNRPEIKQLWRESSRKSINEIIYTMVQCWDQNPDARITSALVALRMKEISS